ncbi:hypothetical protein BV20DRAFT_1120956 [Pilatotrama ljubarskyi]|nr:hypothetical protein BV20DRAFT_1120956 [Pilatotrama ljubarskyi]
MPVNLTIVSSFKALLHRFLGTRMVADEPTLRFLLDDTGTHAPGPLDVDLFENYFVQVCRLNIRRNGGRDILSECRISPVVLYKQRGKPDHEYIVADVVVPASDDTPERALGGLKAVRTVHVVATDDGESTKHSRPSSPASSSGGTIRIQALDRFFAWDLPTRSRLPKGHQVALKHVFAVSERPSITLLVGAAAALHEHAPDCHQPYWFAAMLFRILVGEASEQLPHRARITISVADEPRRVNARTFMEVFNVVTKEDIRKTVAAIESNVLSKEAQIQDRLRALRAEHEAEQQRARASMEALERRAEIAEGRAKIADREAEAAKRRAEAAEKALEDLRAQLTKVHHDDVPSSSAPLAG